MSNEKEFVILENIIITPLIKAHTALKKALAETSTELERDGCIQRFEFTYELFWKTLKKILKFKGVIVNNPRDVFREAAKEGLIEDPKFWFEVITKRNLTTHTYREESSIEVFEALPEIAKRIEIVVDKIKAL